MYSFTRSWIGPKLARMLIQRQGRRQDDQGQRDAVDAELVLDAEGGTQSALLDELEAASAPMRSKPTRSRSETTQASERRGEGQRRGRQAARGRKAITSAPTSGTKVTSDRSGRPLIAPPPAITR